MTSISRKKGDARPVILILAHARREKLEQTLRALALANITHRHRIIACVDGDDPGVLEALGRGIDPEFLLQSRSLGNLPVSSRIRSSLRTGLSLGFSTLGPPYVTVIEDDIVVAPDFLDFVADYFPAPIDRTGVNAKKNGEDFEIKCDPKGEPNLLVFKSLSEPHVGELSIFKVYSGSLHAGLDLENTTLDKSERLSQLFVLNGKNRKDMTNISAGDIGAVVKLKDTHTGNTLSSKGSGIILSPIQFP